MTKQEFETLTGKQVSEKEFYNIHEMYMNVGDHIDKQTFCTEYSKIANSPLFNTLAINYNRERESRNQLQKEQREVAEMLIEKAEEHSDQHLEAAACEILGWKKVLQYKLKHEIELTPHDRELLINQLV